MPAHNKTASADNYAGFHKSLADLTPDPRNANKGTERGQQMIANSLREYGAGRSILLDKHGRIIAGNKTAQNAGAAGLSDVIVVETDGTQLVAVQRMDLDLDDPRAKQMAIADNRSGQVSLDWDIDVLKELATEIDLAPFWNADELEAMWPQNADLLTDEDAVPELPEEPVTKQGDLYILGRHRLLCGDSTIADDVGRLLDGGKPHLMVTDPPYGVQLDSEWRDRAGFNGCGPAQPSYMREQGDTIADWSHAFALVPSLTVAYVWHASSYTREVLDGLLRIGFDYHQQIIWNKGHAMLTRTHYWIQHEPAWYVRKKKAPWYGKAGQPTVWDAAPPKFIMGGSKEEKFDHPTQKPVEIMRIPILNHTKRGELVYEPFSGSGTTLMACETEGRACLGMELSPAYCDVIVQRWQDATGQKAVLDGPAA